MCKSARHSGKIGDIIFSLPTIKALGVEVLYIPQHTGECNSLYDNVKDLLLIQPYIKEVREYTSNLPYKFLDPKLPVTYDLDLARDQPQKGLIHIVKRYMDAFGVKYENWKEPWLWVPGYSDENRLNWHQLPKEYVLINYTGRHIHNDYLNITSQLDWAKVMASIDLPKFFVGHYGEYDSFRERFNIQIPFVFTDNMLQLARIIKDAHSVYCNQSSVLALSQALGKTYYLEPKPMKRNCLLETKNENILQ